MVALKFESDICEIVGAGAATVYQNIYYWCERNEANELHFYEGRYWTYNSQAAFSRLFKCFSERQVRAYLNKLIDADLILVGDFNKSKRERVNWYAVNPRQVQPTKPSGGGDQTVGCNRPNRRMSYRYKTKYKN